jgi:hypothetical protein
MKRTTERKKHKKLTPRVVHRMLEKNPKYHLIEIDGGDPVPLKIIANPGDNVVWGNKDTGKWLVSFDDWPFEKTLELIEVPAGKPSTWYKVSANPGQGVMKTFKYGLKRLTTDPDPPPDGPGVIVDGG